MPPGESVVHGIWTAGDLPEARSARLVFTREAWITDTGSVRESGNHGCSWQTSTGYESRRIS